MKNSYRDIKSLIPDLLPDGHVPLNTKRMRFIAGQGAVIYDDKYAVEVYTSRSKSDHDVFFGIHKHHGNLSYLKNNYQKVDFIHISDDRISERMHFLFDEAIFQDQPIENEANTWIFPKVKMKRPGGIKTIEYTMNSNLSGAA